MQLKVNVKTGIFMVKIQIVFDFIQEAVWPSVLSAVFDYDCKLTK